MMIHTKSTTIVALNMPEEDKTEPEPRPVEYWRQNCLQEPVTFEDWKTFDKEIAPETVITLDNWTIQCVARQVVAKDDGTDFAIVKREFRARNSQTEEERTITQFHFQNWPDFEGAPTDRLFKILLELVEAHHKATDVPLTVHCAAGMGRAGSFIAAHSMRRKIRSELEAGKALDEITVNLARTIFTMREHRKDMVADKGMPCICNALNI
jgi:protein tyrosine phosphatase